jgi:IS605 OrfB family transposase
LLHRISNELVAETRENGCTVIAFEELTDIRERTGASWGHKWAFNRLYEHIEYKAVNTTLIALWVHAPGQPRW